MQRHDRQQARQQFAQHQLGVRQSSEQQQIERTAILLDGHRTGRGHGGEEQRHGQLQGRQKLERRGAEPRQIARVAHVLRPAEHLPGGAQQDQQRPDVRRARNVQSRPARRANHLAGKDWSSEQAGSPERGCMRFAQSPRGPQRRTTGVIIVRGTRVAEAAPIGRTRRCASATGVSPPWSSSFPRIYSHADGACPRRPRTRGQCTCPPACPSRLWTAAMQNSRTTATGHTSRATTGVRNQTSDLRRSDSIPGRRHQHSLKMGPTRRAKGRQFRSQPNRPNRCGSSMTPTAARFRPRATERTLKCLTGSHLARCWRRRHRCGF